MNKETTTLWNVPVLAIPYVINALEEYASNELFNRNFAMVEKTMKTLQDIQEDYDFIQKGYAENLEVEENDAN